MVRNVILPLLLAGAASLSSSLVEAKKPASGVQKAKTIPGSYIVEFEDAADRSDFLSHVDGVADMRMNLEYSLFRGSSIQFKDLASAPAEAAKIQSLPSIKNVWPNRVYYLPDDEVVWTEGTSSADESLAHQVRRQAGNDTFSPHVMTQVDKLRAQGIVGEGIKIGVIDSGVDYNHPALGGCFGEGCLVSYGTDLVGDDYNGDNQPVPDDDPWDGCQGHGTHVSGIIAAQAPNKYGFTGAAPGVTLGQYRVFGCTGGAGNDVLIDAYLQAFEAGSQIITASIGGASGWSEDPWAVVVSRIVEAGVPCTVSAGNDGSYGLFYASTASNGKRVTSIASFDNEVTPMLLTESSFSVDAGSDETFGYAVGEPAEWAGVELPLWAVTYDTTAPTDACDPLPADTPDLSEYIVLIRRGSCTFVQKATNAAEYGARYIMFYNNVPAGATGPALTEVEAILANGMVPASTGESWVAALEAGSTVTLSMTDPETAEVVFQEAKNTLTGGFASTFTTWNPTFEMDVKPQLAAPGGSILSTYPVPLGSYAVLSGTSMACPMAAAIYALIANVRGTFDPATIENLLAATANPQLYNDGTATYGSLAPVAQQGAGMVRAYDAAYATTLLSKSSLAFNDTDYLEPTTNFTITNLGAEPVTYDLAHVGASTGYTFSTDIYPDYFPGLEITSEFASLSFSEAKVTVPAGGEVSVSVTVAPPEVDGSRLPVYSGFVTLNGTNGDSLSLPYNGAVGSLHSTLVLDEGYLSTSSDEALNPIVGTNSSFVLPAPGSTADPATAYPVVVALLAFGTPLLDVQLVGAGNSTAAGLGSIYGFPMEYMPRDPYYAAWDGEMADGTYAPEGKYAFKVKALRVYGNREVESEYDVDVTAPFSIRYV